MSTMLQNFINTTSTSTSNFFDNMVNLPYNIVSSLTPEAATNIATRISGLVSFYSPTPEALENAGLGATLIGMALGTFAIATRSNSYTVKGIMFLSATAFAAMSIFDLSQNAQNVCSSLGDQISQHRDQSSLYYSRPGLSDMGLHERIRADAVAARAQALGCDNIL